MGALRCYGVLHTAVQEVWAEAEPLIEAGLAYNNGKYSTSDIRTNIENRSMQLWVAYDDEGLRGVGVTQIINYPNSKCLLFFLYAGTKIDNVLPFFKETICEWGRDLGCDSVELFGRDGWERVFKNHGFKKIHTVLRLDLREPDRGNNDKNIQ